MVPIKVIVSCEQLVTLTWAGWWDISRRVLLAQSSLYESKRPASDRCRFASFVSRVKETRACWNNERSNLYIHICKWEIWMEWWTINIWNNFSGKVFKTMQSTEVFQSTYHFNWWNLFLVEKIQNFMNELISIFH